LTGARFDIVESKMNQKKLTDAMNAMRKCTGTTLKVRHCVGVQMSQYFHSKSFFASLTYRESASRTEDRKTRALTM
jgi:hypothetical protein